MNPLIIGSALGAGIGGGLVLIRRGLTAAHIPLGDVFKTAESQSPCKLPRTPGGSVLSAASRRVQDAQMAELVDALASGASAGNGVEVRVLFWAPIQYN